MARPIRDTDAYWPLHPEVVEACNLELIDGTCRSPYPVEAAFDLAEAGRSTAFIPGNEGSVTALEVFSRICLEAVRECGPNSDSRTIEGVVRRRMESLPPDEREAVTAAVESLISYQPPAVQEHGEH